jgi:hypothetical protein
MVVLRSNQRGVVPLDRRRANNFLRFGKNVVKIHCHFIDNVFADE